MRFPIGSSVGSTTTQAPSAYDLKRARSAQLKNKPYEQQDYSNGMFTFTGDLPQTVTGTIMNPIGMTNGGAGAFYVNSTGTSVSNSYSLADAMKS